MLDNEKEDLKDKMTGKGRKKATHTPIGKYKKGFSKLKIKEPRQINASNRHELKYRAKKTPMGRAIVDTYPDLTFDDFDHEKYVHIRAAFIEFLNTKTTGEIYELLELKELYRFMKKTTMARLQEKIRGKAPFDKLDWERMDKIFEHLERLHKLRHGEMKTVVKADFTFIRDLTKTSGTSETSETTNAEKEEIIIEQQPEEPEEPTPEPAPEPTEPFTPVEIIDTK